MKSNLNKDLDRKSAKKFLLYGIISYLGITILAFSGAYSPLIDGFFSINEGAGIVASVIIFGIPPMISATLLGRAHGLFINQPFTYHAPINVLFITIYYVLLMVIHFYIGIYVWRLYL